MHFFGEDLLSEREVENLHDTHAAYSHVTRLVLCGDEEILAPPQKKKAVRSGHTRLHNVAIKKIINGNLIVLGHIP